MKNLKKPNNINGVGVGLRSKHFSTFIEERPDVPWLEVLADNFLNTQGILLEKLTTIAEHYPMVLHSVNLSISGTDPLDKNYLNELKRLQQMTDAQWISDHLCFSSHQTVHSHELLPLPFTQEVITHIVNRIKQVQDFLQQQILIENISSYLRFKIDKLFEAEFLSKIAEQADCFILLDVNNVYVNSQHHNFNAEKYFEYLDPKRIKQIHLGGYTEHNDLLIDTHGEAVHEPVWRLYDLALQTFGAIPTCIEWDAAVPPWQELYQQTLLANKIFKKHDYFSRITN